MHTFCCKKRFMHTFLSRKRFTHFVRKVFARWKLPSGKFRLFGPLCHHLTICFLLTYYQVKLWDLEANRRVTISPLLSFVWFDNQVKLRNELLVYLRFGTMWSPLCTLTVSWSPLTPSHMCNAWYNFTLISTECALRLPTTYDNQCHPSTKPLKSSKQALDWSESISNDLQWLLMTTYDYQWLLMTTNDY